jgi:F-box-like
MISIDILPDDVLLEIFDFHLNEISDEDLDIDYKIVREQWQTLVHVCRRWRSVVFGSPRRLKLRLVCTQGTPTRDTLDLWPSLPLVIRDSVGQREIEDVDEIIAVLERKDRVVEIFLIFVDCSNLENILAAMQATLPELTRLILRPSDEDDGIVSVLPDSFLGGSAPRLESLTLERIPFPGLPKLLLSATRLVGLRLENIPHSGYISPEVMVTALSTLTSLEHLSLLFKSPLSRPDWANRRMPPPTRSVLPALTLLCFKGVGEYLDDVVARIDAPQLKILVITLFNQILFDTPQFIQFITRTPMLKAFDKALVRFAWDTSRVNFSSQTPGYGTLNVWIPCKELDWQVSSMEQVCTSCLPPLSTLEDLYIYENPLSPPVWQDNIENALWLELLQPFTAVKNLYLSEEFASRIVPALQDLVEGRSTEVLPVLQNIFLEELQPSATVQAAIQKFVAARQVTSHPIAVSRWDDPKEVMNRLV